MAAVDRSSSDTYNRPYSAATGEWPLWKLSMVALPMVTVQATWVFLMPCSAPYLQYLGLSASMATLNNMAGPLTGFFTGPLVGAMSDSLASPYGRRRPVIFVGLVLTWVAGILFTMSEHVMPVGMSPLMAAPMFWVLDVTINILQAPHRALVADLSSDAQQVQMQVMIVCMQAVGTLIGFSIMNIYDVPVEHMLELVLLICLLNTVAVGIQCSVAEERPAAKNTQAERSIGSRVLAPVLDVVEAAKGSCHLFRRLAAVQCLIAVGGSAWSLYSAQWFGICVYQGDPSAPSGSPEYEAYAAGQRQFAHSGQSKSVLHLVCSLLVISILRSTRVRPMTIYAVLIFLGAMTSTAAALFVQHNSTLAVVCATLSVLPFAGSNAIPFGLVATISKRAEKQGFQANVALHMALLNCASTFGSQLCTITLAIIEGNTTLAQALPLIFMVAAVAEYLGGIGALLADGSADDILEDKSYKCEMEEGMLT